MFVCMKKNNKPAALSAVKKLSFLLTIIFMVVLSNGCRKNNEPKVLRDFGQVNLVATNNEYGATHIDPALMNAWGLAFSPGGTPWVNSNGGHISSVYDKEGAFIPARPAVNIPSPDAATGGTPTGIVFNGVSTNFVLSNGRSAAFIFVGEDGVLSAWNGLAGNNAIRVHHNPNASYKGLALAMNNGASYLYAADFKARKIAVWNNTFAPVEMSFKDNQIPDGYAPFNIQAIGSWLYVTYAKVGPDGDDQKGPGHGFVDVFNTDGSLVKRFAERGRLNSPWGVAMAPVSFFMDTDQDKDDKNGKENSGDGSGISKGAGDENVILVGNFGDGRINVFRLNGDFLGQLRSHGHDIVIDGLWALVFPPATATAIDPNRLYFTAGPNDEADGLFGYIIKQ